MKKVRVFSEKLMAPITFEGFVPAVASADGIALNMDSWSRGTYWTNSDRWSRGTYWTNSDDWSRGTYWTDSDDWKRGTYWTNSDSWNRGNGTWTNNTSGGK